MSSSDARMWADLVARVNKLEELMESVVTRVEWLGDKVEGKEVPLWEDVMDHAADRAERAELQKRAIPGRPTGPKAA